jgi:hypothetical protein
MRSRKDSDAQLIKRQQREWARNAGITVNDAGYSVSPHANLPWLSTLTRRDFSEADGQEFGNETKVGKIAAAGNRRLPRAMAILASPRRVAIANRSAATYLSSQLRWPRATFHGNSPRWFVGRITSHMRSGQWLLDIVGANV